MRITFFLLFLSTLLAGQRDVGAYSVHEIKSELLGQSRPFYVHLPAGYDTLSTPPAVLYVLDAESRFPLTYAIADYQRFSAGLPPVVVVGIPNRSAEERGTFFLPGPGSQSDTFLRHLREELVPAVDSLYRVSSRRYLMGHSHGAVFTIYALLRDPQVFVGYLASDPSVKPLLPLADTLLRTTYPDIRLYHTSTDVAYGYLEEVRDDIHADQLEFRQLLASRAPAGLSIAYEHIPDDHGNGYVPAINFGLRYLFFGWQRPAD